METLRKQRIILDFILKFRAIELSCLYLEISEDITEEILTFLTALLDVEFSEAKVHAFYGRVKKITAAFHNFLVSIADLATKESSNFVNAESKLLILCLINKNIEQQSQKQNILKNTLLKYSGVEEVDEKLAEKFDSYVALLSQLKRECVLLQKQHEIKEFIVKQMDISMKRFQEIITFVHSYFSQVLGDLRHELRISLEDILKHISKNNREVTDEYEEKINGLLNQLYQKNIETSQARKEKDMETLEQHQLRINKIRSEIDTVSMKRSLKLVQEEMKFWEKKKIDFDRIEMVLSSLKDEKEYVLQQQRIYNSRRCIELPGSKLDCWVLIGDALKERLLFLEEKILNACKALFTHFSVRGLNRVKYQDPRGDFTLDPYRHYGYRFNYGLKQFHINCDGELNEIPEDDMVLYRNDYGRHLIDKNGNKIYKREMCCSEYELDTNNLFVKLTKDCGHSERPNPKCALEIDNPMRTYKMIPNAKPVDIKGKLTKTEADYLWHEFGDILPKVLANVSNEQPRNPIHYIAHQLIRHRCKPTHELVEGKKSAEQFRNDIFDNRIKRLQEASKAWKSRHIVPSKTYGDDFDDYDPVRQLIATRELQQYFQNILDL